ncbi:MAG TPA: alpha/beta hydrolase-fold protein [Segetibacter sp.]
MSFINKSLVFFLFLFCGITVQAIAFADTTPSRIVVQTLHSDVLKEDRRIHIYTPLNMKKDEAYPVLYLLDGEAHIALAAGQVQYLSEAYKIIPSLIIVAIENTNRVRDLTPTNWNIGADGKPDTSKNAFGRTSGGADKFLQFLKQELMPYVESNYPTAPYRILSGHSLGGLLGIHSMVNHPGLFNAFIAISPSLQWDNERMLAEASKKIDPKQFSNTLLFFSDANEGSAFHQNQTRLDSILKGKNVPPASYKYIYYPEELHTSEPVKAFYDGLRHIYPNWHLPYNNSAFKKSMSAKIIKDHFAELSAKYGYKIKPLHDEINQISRFLRNDPNRIKDAIELLEMNAEHYPTSVVVYEHLGDTYYKASDIPKATTSFEKALQLDPKNEQLKQKVASLKLNPLKN